MRWAWFVSMQLNTSLNFVFHLDANLYLLVADIGYKYYFKIISVKFWAQGYTWKLNPIYTLLSTFKNKQTKWRLYDGSVNVLRRHKYSFPPIVFSIWMKLFQRARNAMLYLLVADIEYKHYFKIISVKFLAQGYTWQLHIIYTLLSTFTNKQTKWRLSDGHIFL